MTAFKAVILFWSQGGNLQCKIDGSVHALRVASDPSGHELIVEQRGQASELPTLKKVFEHVACDHLDFGMFS